MIITVFKIVSTNPNFIFRMWRFTYSGILETLSSKISYLKRSYVHVIVWQQPKMCIVVTNILSDSKSLTIAKIKKRVPKKQIK